jgi:hypothetical protein
MNNCANIRACTIEGTTKLQTPQRTHHGNAAVGSCTGVLRGGREGAGLGRMERLHG